MRPINYSSSEPVKTYNEEKQERFAQWDSEISDLIAKIKGSSLRGEDKDLALKKLMASAINAQEI